MESQPDTEALPSEHREWKITNLTLRDGQQSTLALKDWVLDTAKMARILVASQKAGFDSAEIAGGQSFQTAISNGYNPFAITDALSNALVSADGSVLEIELQMLFRGANALGFRHYDKDVVEATLREFIKNGITKIRCFDALNDIDNLDIPESVRDSKGVVMQGALCFGHYHEAPERYTDDYFLAYAKQLVEKGFRQIAIKDMSGQMTAARIATLLPKLQEYLRPQGIPIELHIHSTNELTSREAATKAIELGIDSIETVEGPLAGGSSHHSLESIAPSRVINQRAYRELVDLSTRVWGTQIQRKDEEIQAELKTRLCRAGVPGGAMPFVIRDLKTQMPTIVAKRAQILEKEKNRRDKFVVHREGVATHESHGELDFSDVLELFLIELKRVCKDAGYPLLVTPTADICCKQAISNLAFSVNPYSEDITERYIHSSGNTGADPRFAKLVLGHYGECKAYDQKGSVYRSEENVLDFFEEYNPLQLTRVKKHPSTKMLGNDMCQARAAAWKLIHTQGSKALSFANFDQLTLMYALRPAGAHGVDPIEKAVLAYTERADSVRIGETGVTFPGFKVIMQPILEHLGALFAQRSTITPEQAMNLPLGTFGQNLYRRLFRTYVTLPITQEVTRVRNNLTNLISSDHTSPQLKESVALVGASFDNLDFRPVQVGETHYEEAREAFRQLSIADLFGALALTHSLINSVDKHGTDPWSPVEKAITMAEIRRYGRSKIEEGATEWERKLASSIGTRYYQVETVLQRHIERWRSID